jgi:hypothetical protein
MQSWTAKAAPEGSTWAPGWDTNTGFGMSSDGLKLVGLVYNQRVSIVTSIDGGETWIKSPTAADRDWAGIALSADGQTLYGQAWDEAYGSFGIYRSHDAGASWSLEFEAPSFTSLSTNANGSAFYGLISGGAGSFPFSSTMTSLTELKGTGAISLIYLGENTFARQ